LDTTRQRPEPQAGTTMQVLQRAPAVHWGANAPTRLAKVCLCACGALPGLHWPGTPRGCRTWHVCTHQPTRTMSGGGPHLRSVAERSTPPPRLRLALAACRAHKRTPHHTAARWRAAPASNTRPRQACVRRWRWGSNVWAASKARLPQLHGAAQQGQRRALPGTAGQRRTGVRARVTTRWHTAQRA
jgi:hypothetical protein